MKNKSLAILQMMAAFAAFSESGLPMSEEKRQLIPDPERKYREPEKLAEPSKPYHNPKKKSRKERKKK